MRRLLLILITLAMIPGLWMSGPVDAAQQKQASAVVQQTAPEKPGAFVGAETCALCHADVAKKFSSNPHSELALMHGGKGVTCESCHGPGGAHVASGGDPTKILQLSKMSAKQVDTTCLSCHASAHPNFLRSDHGKAGVSCISCHSIHGLATAVIPNGPATPAATAAKKSGLGARLFSELKPDASISDPVQFSAASIETPGQNPHLLRAPQPQLCFSCHSDVKPAFSQPFHHKVNEGLMKCTDCHDAHGTFGNNQLRSTADQNMICTKCHTETRGPFVFEHAAVKAEGCVGCHTPHGSQNARLLNVPNINQMCNQCHSPVAAGTIHGMGAGSAEVQSCVSCHTMIHGSNINPAFIR
jgi:predicted CXXCH cytochrome family protein